MTGSYRTGAVPRCHVCGTTLSLSETECPFCDGTGFSGTTDCLACWGFGRRLVCRDLAAHSKALKAKERQDAINALGADVIWRRMGRK